MKMTSSDRTVRLKVVRVTFDFTREELRELVVELRRQLVNPRHIAQQAFLAFEKAALPPAPADPSGPKVGA